MDALPLEIIYGICEYLSGNDINNLSRTSPRLGKILNRHYWGQKAKERLNIPICYFNVRPADRYDQLRRLNRGLGHLDQIKDKSFLIDLLDIESLKYLSSRIKWSIYDMGYSIRVGLPDLFYHIYNNCDYDLTVNYQRFLMTEKNYPIIAAVLAGNVDILQLLLKDGRFNPRHNDDNALLYAIDNAANNLTPLLLLIKDPRVYISASHLIRAASSVKTLKLIIDNIGDYNYDNVLALAVRMGKYQELVQLLECIKPTDNIMHTLLLRCAERFQSACAYQILLKVRDPANFLLVARKNETVKLFVDHVFHIYDEDIRAKHQRLFDAWKDN